MTEGRQLQVVGFNGFPSTHSGVARPVVTPDGVRFFLAGSQRRAGPAVAKESSALSDPLAALAEHPSAFIEAHVKRRRLTLLDREVPIDVEDLDKTRVQFGTLAFLKASSKAGGVTREWQAVQSAPNVRARVVRSTVEVEFDLKARCQLVSDLLMSCARDAAHGQKFRGNLDPFDLTEYAILSSRTKDQFIAIAIRHGLLLKKRARPEDLQSFYNLLVQRRVPCFKYDHYQEAIRRLESTLASASERSPKNLKSHVAFDQLISSVTAHLEEGTGAAEAAECYGAGSDVDKAALHRVVRRFKRTAVLYVRPAPSTQSQDSLDPVVASQILSCKEAWEEGVPKISKRKDERTELSFTMTRLANASNRLKSVGV